MLGSWREGVRCRGPGDRGRSSGFRVQGSESEGGERGNGSSPRPSTLDPLSSRIAYGFVHGNWALCNSRPDGDWCGVNEELTVLAQTGCYADFTFPSAPSPTQPRMVNAVCGMRHAVCQPACRESRHRTPALPHSRTPLC
jgi:hypothetical protein